MASTPGFEPGPLWWEASALTTVPPMLPKYESEAHSNQFPVLLGKAIRPEVFMIATIPEKNQKKNQCAQQSSPLKEKKYFGLCLIIDENNYKRSRYLDCLMLDSIRR